jgi:hypothetical protein
MRRTLPPRTARLPSAPVAFAVYLIAALALFGAPLLHGGECVCITSTTDAGVSAWALKWWPHAVAHLDNPFKTDLIYAPYGFDLAHGQLFPAAALVLWPVTAVLAAFFAFLLCRRLAGGRFWPALLGGWLFGFSAYMLGQLTSHLNLTLVFLVPAMVHLVLRFAAGELTRTRFVVFMAAALALQVGFSAEVLVSFSLIGALTLAAAWQLGDREARRAIADAVVPALGIAYAAAAVISLPYLYYALKPGGVPVLSWRSDKFSSDLLSFVVPSRTAAVGGRTFATTTSAFTSGFLEGGAYLGLPLLALAGYGAWRLRREAAVRVAAAGAGIAALLSLGGLLHAHGATGIPLPWALVNQAPITGLLMPARFAAFTALAVAILAAMALARHGGVVLWVLGVLAVVSLVPALGHGYWRSRPARPALFTDAAYRSELRSSDTVLALPIGIAGQGMLWQADRDLGFRMAGGYVVPPEGPDPYQRFAIYPSLVYGGGAVPGEDAKAQEFLRATRTTAVAFDPHWTGRDTWTGTLERLGWEGRAVGGALVFRPSRARPDPRAPAEARAVAMASFRAFAAGDGTRFCALQADHPRCTAAVAGLLRAPGLRAAARGTHVGAATITGLRGSVAIRAPGRPVQHLPVVRVRGRWVVAGAPGP